MKQCPLLRCRLLATCGRLRRRSFLRRRAGLRRTSARGRRRRRQWARIRAAYLAANPWCERCLHTDNRRREASQVHHIIGGHGGRVHMWWNLIALCRRCHNGNVGFAHERPRESRSLCIEIKRAKVEWRIRPRSGAGPAGPA